MIYKKNLMPKIEKKLKKNKNFGGFYTCGSSE
jgi:hypothetical protein